MVRCDGDDCKSNIVIVRTATAADKTRVIVLLRHSRDAAGFDSEHGPTGFNFAFDPAYAEQLFLSHLSQSCLCLVLDVADVVQGVLMASSAPHPFGPVVLARETVWWIEPDHRMSWRQYRVMLGAYEAWANERGCAFA